MRFRWVGAVIAAGMVVTAIPVFQFYQGYWTRLQRLPAIVRQDVRSHQGPYTRLAAVSPWFPEALIATEDRTFRSNLGVSLEGIGRSLTVDLATGQFAQGGSTLTQQLVRDTLLSPVKRFRRKLSEALLAVAATMLYSKQDILTMYINYVYLGNGAYGIGMASRRYFGVTPARLNLPQAAMLAGLPQAPSYLNPDLHYLAAKHRQWEVLLSMVADHMISSARAKQAFRSPLALRRGPA